MRQLSWITIFAALVLAGFVRAGSEEKVYDLRGPAPQKGQTIATNMVVTIKEADMSVKLGGQALKLKQTLIATTQEEEKILAVKGRQVVKSQSRIVKDSVRIIALFMGQKNEETVPNELQGEVVISERNDDGKWKHVLVDTKPSEKQKKELDKRLGPESDDELYPVGKVKVGHTWTVDARAMKRFFGNSFSDITGKVNQKFVKLEEIDGDLCAVVESAGKIKAKMKDDDGGKGLNVDLDMTSTSWRSLKTGVERKGAFKGHIRIAGKQKISGMDADVDIDGPITGESTSGLK